MKSKFTNALLIIALFVCTFNVFANNDDLTKQTTIHHNSSFLVGPATHAEGDINQVPIDGTVDGDLLRNDSDEENDVQTITAAQDALGNPLDISGTPNVLASGAQIIIFSSGYYYFVAAPGVPGEEMISYTVCDDAATMTCVTETLVIQVIPEVDLSNNNAPIAHDDTNTVEQGGQVTTIVIVNDLDIEYDVLSVTNVECNNSTGGVDVVSNVSSTLTDVYDDAGTLAGTAYYDSAIGEIVFNANATYEGKVSMTYTVSDGNGGSDIGVATISVEPSDAIDNDVYANDDAAIGFGGGFLSNTLFANDYDPDGNSFTITAAEGSAGPIALTGAPTSLGSGGSINVYASGGYDYVSSSTFVGTEVIVYTICDDGSPQACETASLYLTSIPTNSTFAKADFINTMKNTPITANVLLNDDDVEGDIQTAVVSDTMPVTEGIITMALDGTYEFVPALDFVGETSFEYTVCDDGSPQACQTEKVTIEILPSVTSAGQAPIANFDRNQIMKCLEGTGDILSNDYDPDGSEIVVDSIFFDSDGDGMVDSIGMVDSLIIIGGMHEEGYPVTNAGELTILADGSYVYDPNPGFWGEVVVDYKIKDENAELDASTLVLEVIPNDGSNNTFANDDAAITDRDITVFGNVLDNDHDPQQQNQGVSYIFIDKDGEGIANDSLIFGTQDTIYGTDTSGMLVIGGFLQILSNGAYTFEPATDFIGNVVVSYIVCDPSVPEACDEATLTINVQDARRDYGDASPMYPVAWHRGIEESTGNSIPNGATDVWLGLQTDLESVPDSTATADGDLYDDAMTFGVNPGDFPAIVDPNTTYNVNLVVNSTNPTTVYYGMWIDYNMDGVFDQFYGGSEMTASPATAVVTITTPADVAANDVVVRVRVDDDPLLEDDFEGGKTNGEIEDYQLLIALPVELVEFNANMDDCEAVLEWTTASEIDSDKFEIEHSIDGIDFKVIGSKLAFGQSSAKNDYRFVDLNTTPGLNYYRLKQIDKNGTYTYSELAVVDNECEDHVEVQVYPNPTFGQVFVKLSDEYSDDVISEIVLNDATGRILQTLSVDVAPDGTIGIDLSEYSKGMYYLRIKRGKMMYRTHAVMKW